MPKSDREMKELEERTRPPKDPMGKHEHAKTMTEVLN